MPDLCPGRDYTIDALGRMVLTAGYLLRRGECCGNKCRNCPYGWRDVPDAMKTPDEPQPPLDGWEGIDGAPPDRS